MFLSDKDAEKIYKKFDERKELLIEIKEAIDNLGVTQKESTDKLGTAIGNLGVTQKESTGSLRTAIGNLGVTQKESTDNLGTTIDNLTKAINNLSGGNKFGLEDTETKK